MVSLDARDARRGDRGRLLPLRTVGARLPPAATADRGRPAGRSGTPGDAAHGPNLQRGAARKRARGGVGAFVVTIPCIIP